MLFKDSRREYPHLAQALNVLSRPEHVQGSLVDRYVPVVAGATVVTIVAGAKHLTELFALGVVAICVTGGTALRSFFRTTKTVQRRNEEAIRVAQTMALMLSKRRLHRDLDTASLLLLDECAKQWLRAKTAFNASYWSSKLVPEHYGKLRESAVPTLDQSMDEVLLHYQEVLPDTVHDRHATDYVEEALENVVFGRGKTAHPPAAFVPVREIADKLRTLADEAERIIRDSRSDTVLAPDLLPPSKLDQTLADLRAIREAEEELRHNTGA